MLFDKIFKAVLSDNAKKTGEINPKENVGMSTPKGSYVQTKSNIQPMSDKDYDYLVLHWISKKKNGYDLSSNKYPKWFANTYGIDFNQVARRFIEEGELTAEGNTVIVSSLGKDSLKKYSYVIYVYEHPKFEIKLDDYRKHPNLGNVQNSDIAWGIFNQRILMYTEKQMWNSLALNYSNMADLLIEEKKYEQALDYVFVTAYMETSGMLDNNELTPIMTEFTGKQWKKQFLPNGMPDIFLLEVNNYWVTVPFIKIQKELNLEWDVVKERFITGVFVKSLEELLPFKYFEKEESFEIFKEAIQNAGSKGIFPLKDVSKKLKWNIPDENSEFYFYASTENKVNRKFK